MAVSVSARSRCSNVAPGPSGRPSAKKIFVVAGQGARGGCDRGREAPKSFSMGMPAAAQADAGAGRWGGVKWGEGEFARAVIRVREREPRDRAGNADGERGVLRFARIGFAPLVEENLARGRCRRGLAIVDRGVGLAAGAVDQHVAAATD